MEKDDEITGVTGSHLDFGARIYDSRIGRWLSTDPLASKYPYSSPYTFAAGDPIRLIDKDGLEPIDPRTGKPIRLNLSRAAAYCNKYNNYAKLAVVRDHDLYDYATQWWGDRKRENPDNDDLLEGSPYFRHKSVWENTPQETVQALGMLFPSVENPGLDYGSPNDPMWRNVATQGTYLFVDDTYAESEIVQANKLSFNIMTVEQNYITQIVHLARSDKYGEFNISYVTNFDIKKGDIQTREVNKWWGTKTEKYRTLNVTETTELYKNNKATGKTVNREYTREEIID